TGGITGTGGANSIGFAGPGITLAAGQTFDAGGSSLTVSSPINLGAFTLTVTGGTDAVGAPLNEILSGPITGSGGVTRLGNANWLLASQPNSPNAFTGSVVVGASNSGALQINSGQSLGQAADTAVQSGGPLQVINTATTHVPVAQHPTLPGTRNQPPGALH